MYLQQIHSQTISYNYLYIPAPIRDMDVAELTSLIQCTRGSIYQLQTHNHRSLVYISGAIRNAVPLKDFMSKKKLTFANPKSTSFTVPFTSTRYPSKMIQNQLVLQQKQFMCK
ncbi:unnamed protein product, partial [Vitis vinifera]|uniref:Uncharacterized protein n=1 Tax=Vitis vinifera TaxID=29760 RepID=D7T069_VITVI